MAMLTWAPTGYFAEGPEVSRYIEFKPNVTEQQDVDKERAALQQYGVNMGAKHKLGYAWEPSALGIERAAPLWGSGLTEQMGPTKPIQCAVADKWNNEEFVLEIRDGIAYCTLNRPAANNAISEGIGNGLHDAALILRNRSDIRIVVLTGAGRMFCAGGDPRSFSEGHASAAKTQRSAMGEAAPEGQNLAEDQFDNPVGAEISGYAKAFALKEDYSCGLERTLMEWANLPQFTICCMNGSAMGGGVGLVCACDMVIAIKTAHIVLSEVKLGVIPAAVAPLVVRTIGPNNAKRLFVSSENCNVALAKQMGLVQRSVEEVAEFAAVIKEVAGKIQALAPGAVAATKKSLISCDKMPISEQLMEFASSEYVKARTLKECEDGMKALASKKRPVWMEKQIAVKE